MDVTSGGLGRRPGRAASDVRAPPACNIVRGRGLLPPRVLPGRASTSSPPTRWPTRSCATSRRASTACGPGSSARSAATGCITALEERSFRAAARAHRRTGLTITTHAARWPVGTAAARPAGRGGRRPGPRGDRALRHGAGPRLPPGARASAARGCSSTPCRASTSGTPSSGWTGSRSLADAGYLDRVLLSQDVCLRSDYAALGGPGYAYVVTTFADRLRDDGLRRRRHRPRCSSTTRAGCSRASSRPARTSPAPPAAGRSAARGRCAAARSSSARPGSR